MGFKSWLGKYRLNMDISRIGAKPFWSRVSAFLKTLRPGQELKLREEYDRWKEKNLIPEPEIKPFMPPSGLENLDLPKGIRFDEIEGHLESLRHKSKDTAQLSLFAPKISRLIAALKTIY